MAIFAMSNEIQCTKCIRYSLYLMEGNKGEIEEGWLEI
jgi:hypothetical protein